MSADGARLRQGKRGVGLVKPYGTREHDGKRYMIFQVQDFDEDCYDLSMYFVEDDGIAHKLPHTATSAENSL
jgi:hypothetical protein